MHVYIKVHLGTFWGVQTSFLNFGNGSKKFYFGYHSVWNNPKKSHFTASQRTNWAVFHFSRQKTALNILGAKKTENVQKLRLFWWFWNNVGRHCFFYVFWSPNCFWFVRKTRWEKLKTKPNLVWTKLTFLLTWIFHVFSVFLWNGNSTSEFGWLVPLPSFFLVVHGHFALFSCQWVGV